MTRAEKEKGIRHLPLPEGMARMESGPVAFGDDWPGYFIRGDNAMRLVAGVRLLGLVLKHPELLDRFSTRLQLTSDFAWARSMSSCLLADDEEEADEQG